MFAQGDMASWTHLLHDSTRLLQQANTSTQFPPIQRSLDQLEILSKKLKDKTSRIDAPNQSIAATRLLAREGINAEQLTRDLKTFELKPTFEDVFPMEAANVEEYLQQVHEMAMISAVQEAQKDNLRSFDDYMFQVLEADWQKDRQGFLHNLSRLPPTPKMNSAITSSGISQSARGSSVSTNMQLLEGAERMDLVPSIESSPMERKASAYADVVRQLNAARERGLPFKVASTFKSAHDSVTIEHSVSKSVSMQKIWHLLQALLGEDKDATRNLSRKMSMVDGARRYLEFGHEKYILDTIQSHAAQAALGGSTGNLNRVRAFLRVRLRDCGVLDFDAQDGRRHPPVDTTWQQIYFCLRTGYYDEARLVAQSSRVSQSFAAQLAEWISTGGMVSSATASAVVEECERMLRMGNRAGRAGYDKHKLLLYSIVSGSRQLMDHLLRDLPALFSTIEDFLWFQLSVVRDTGEKASNLSQYPDGLTPYSLDDLQRYLNKFEPSYYTKNGKDPLVYPYVLLLSIQMQSAVQFLTKDSCNEGYALDAVHISIALGDHGVISEGVGTGFKPLMDPVAELANIIRHYGSICVRQGNLALALEYYVQAAATMGGGSVSWTSQGSANQQRQWKMMLRQLLTELFLQDGGIALLLGPNGTGSEGALRRFFPERHSQQQFLIEAAHQCQDAGLYDKSVEIQKRIGAYALALETVNNCLAEAINSLACGRSDGDTVAAGLVSSGHSVLEAYKYGDQSSAQQRDQMVEQHTTLLQLEAILSIHRLAKIGRYGDALKELSNLSFLPLDTKTPDKTAETIHHLPAPVQLCIPDLLKASLICLDNVPVMDGNVHALKSKIATFVANYLPKNWPQELYAKVAQMV